MNIYALELIIKWINIIAVTFVSSTVGIDTKQAKYENDNLKKSVVVAYSIIPFSEETVYKSNIPYGVEKIVTVGAEGVTIQTGNDSSTISEKIDQVKHVGTGHRGEFTGGLTGYGPDCKGCSGRGYVGCRDKNGKYHNLIHDGEYYVDEEYGKMRIVAAPSGSLYENGPSFSCGTIVEVKGKNVETLAIVLDRGGALQNKLANDKILLDLAFRSEAEQLADIRAITERETVSFSVKRWGF